MKYLSMPVDAQTHPDGSHPHPPNGTTNLTQS